MQRRLKLSAARGQQEYHNYEVIFLLSLFAVYFTELVVTPKLVTAVDNFTLADSSLISNLTVCDKLSKNQNREAQLIKSNA